MTAKSPTSETGAAYSIPFVRFLKFPVTVTVKIISLQKAVFPYRIPIPICRTNAKACSAESVAPFSSESSFDNVMPSISEVERSIPISGVLKKLLAEKSARSKTAFLKRHSLKSQEGKRERSAFIPLKTARLKPVYLKTLSETRAPLNKVSANAHPENLQFSTRISLKYARSKTHSEKEELLNEKTSKDAFVKSQP